MKNSTRRLLVMVLLTLVAYAILVAGTSQEAAVSVTWQEAEGFREVSLVTDPEFPFMYSTHLRIAFDHFDWKEQEVTSLEVGPCWENVVFESVGIKNFLALDGIGMGMTFAWNDQLPLIPLAFMIPRRGFFYFICVKERRYAEGLEIESFGKVKRYYLESSASGLDANARVEINERFYFHLSGLKIRRPNLFSQFIQVKIEIVRPVSTLLSISCGLGVDINKVLYKQSFSDEGEKHFLSEDWFGEMTFQGRGNLFTLGFKRRGNQLHPYLKMSLSLLP